MQSKYPILYSFRRCPYAMRARLALVSANIPVILREIDLQHKHPQFLSDSPKGTVPVLILNDATVLDENLHGRTHTLQPIPDCTLVNDARLFLSSRPFFRNMSRSSFPIENLRVMQHPRWYPQALKASEFEFCLGGAISNYPRKYSSCERARTEELNTSISPRRADQFWMILQVEMTQRSDRSARDLF